MSRLSFEKRRAQQPVAHPAAVAVRVSGTGSASVGGTAVVAEPGQEIQQAVLNHLQRLAISLGTPIRATIHNDRAGCVVPLEVSADGSSRVAGDPVRIAAGTGADGPGAGVAGPVVVAPAPARAPQGRFGPPPVMGAVPGARTASGTRAPAPVPPYGPQTMPPAPAPAPVSVPAPASEPAQRPEQADPASARHPGGVLAVSAPHSGPAGSRPVRALLPAAATGSVPAAPAHDPESAPASSPTPTPTPARGFDAVAEEVLGDTPVTETAEGAELLTEPMARINEAVREGRIEAAAELADRTVAEASAVLGPHHPEVLHLGELTAYIAYLAGDPVRSFQLSLDLARLRRQAYDAEAAYGNVRSAATAWRAVRDPEAGLRLGRDLIGLWTDLTTEPGPASGDPEPLESARSRMVRLADRAAGAARA
ncbi:tetratricopeptide repeat protein [Streptomyces cellostaticus]|uniref:tetratricopeptide repeat protein n=1 Tax=Streptomyces cellostaticus TaxID=67285 RepID=UPI002025E3BA|nr:tetratricopeptide repeat protein [Streptomyces cellostaticus]